MLDGGIEIVFVLFAILVARILMDLKNILFMIAHIEIGIDGLTNVSPSRSLPFLDTVPLLALRCATRSSTIGASERLPVVLS